MPQSRLLFFFLGLVVTFVFIRISVRLIRAKVRWWPGNFTPGGTHIHHVVFGTVFMLLGGVIGLAVPDDQHGVRVAAAALLGVGAALVLDEFALLLHLRDVYWTKDGRLSVDAVFLAIGMTGLLLLGARPLGYEEFYGEGVAVRVLIILVNLGFAIVALLKGKVWTGLIGLLVPVLPEIGAVRLARPGSPWARWRYAEGSRKLRRAYRREARIRQPLIQVKIRVQEFISGRHDEEA
ncbi:membrane protein [Saccharothrix sp. NRRL B-16348]|nr:membrane protein [Saccharothrix sp. NRRL B-16348]